MKDIIFTELLDYIKENVSDDFNLPDYFMNFMSNMITYNLPSALFSWHEGEVFQIEINSNSNELTTYNVTKWSF